MHNSSRRTGEKWLPNAIRECPVVRGCREKNQGESFLVDTAQGRFGGGGCGFSFISRIVTRNSGIWLRKQIVGLENLNKVRNAEAQKEQSQSTETIN